MAKSNTFLQTLVLAKQGFDTVRIASREGVSTEMVRRHLARAGFRPGDSVPMVRQSKQIRADSLLFILTMAKEGWLRGEIARASGRSPANISNIIMKMGYSRELLYQHRVTRMREANHGRPWATYCTVPLRRARS